MCCKVTSHHADGNTERYAVGAVAVPNSVLVRIVFVGADLVFFNGIFEFKIDG